MARYIDKEKALLELRKFSFDTSNQYGVGYSDCLTAVEDVLNDLPTADVVEVRHGEWIASKPNPEIMKKFHDMGIGTAMSVNSIHWTCSCCGTWGVPRYNYCTRCGARMDGGKNENLL